MNKSTFEVIIGAIIVIVVITLLYFFYVEANSGKECYPLKAHFNDASGVIIGSKVTIAGIKIGEVVGATFDAQQGNARIEVCIQSDVKIPNDSSFDIVSDGIMSNKSIRVELGISHDDLKPGEVVHDTQSSSSLESLIAKFLFKS